MEYPINALQISKGQLSFSGFLKIAKTPLNMKYEYAIITTINDAPIDSTTLLVEEIFFHVFILIMLQILYAL